MAWRAHRRGRIRRYDLADHKPVEQMADRSKPLLGGRRRSLAGELLDVAGDVHGLYGRDRGHAGALAPRQKLAHCLRVRCISSADCCSIVFTGTKRIDGRLTASQIAAASAASFLLRLT